MPTAYEEQVIRFLRGEENPFDAFVVPDKPAHAFPQCHVAELHADEFTQLCRVLDKFRQPDYHTRRQLHETRAVIVRGVRGSGKTHLLHVLGQRDTPAPAVWVCPRYYDPAFPFPEFLLTELVRTLLSSEEAEAPARLRWCAQAIGRRVLREAVATLTPLEWREWTRAAWPGRPRPGRRRWSDHAALLDHLNTGVCGPARPGDKSLVDVCDRHGLAPPVAHALAVRQIEMLENGTGAATRLRREVLLAFADLALTEKPDRLAALLEQDFAAATDSGLPPARAEVVATLLQTLTEILAAIGVPVAFAFDNMERLLAPRGPVDLPAAQSFFTGLAHVIDQTRGLLVVLFVERGLWNEFGPAINTFAEHRLRQGVRVRDYGCVWDLELKPPTAEQIERVVQRRMAPLLAQAPNGGQLPPCFPFAADEVRVLATAGVDVLRTALLRLRDRYDELILPATQRALPAPSEPPPALDEPTATALAKDVWRREWEQAVTDGRKKLETSRRSALAHALHAGLGRWLEVLRGEVVRGWKLVDATSAVPFGDHPTFGLVTLGTWQSDEARTCRVALGPILGEGRAMPKDLETKFGVFLQRPALAEQLVVLWPITEGRIEVKELPTATRQSWEKLAPGRAVTLQPLTLADFAWLLSFSDWFSTHGAEEHPDMLRRFVLERTSFLLQDCAPVEVPHTPPQESP